MMSDNNVQNSEPLQLSPGPSPLTRPSSIYTDEGDNTVRHHEYYIPSGDVVFKVENTLFRIHRYFLVRDSPVFRDMLSMPPPSNGSPEGVSDENPIHLPRIMAIEFAHFLWVFYNPKYSVNGASLDAWIAILRLAHRWKFAEMRELAFRELDRMYLSPATRLVLAEMYDAAPDWYAEVLTGNPVERFTNGEFARLGPVMKSKINERLEEIRRQSNKN